MLLLHYFLFSYELTCSILIRFRKHETVTLFVWYVIVESDFTKSLIYTDDS